jgi:hypothetical protein
VPLSNQEQNGLKRGKETLVTFFALEKRNYKKKIYNSK